MRLFEKNKKGEYEFELGENEDINEAIHRLKEDLKKGPCPRCNKISMVLDNKYSCYYCPDCGYTEDWHLYLKSLIDCSGNQLDDFDESYEDVFTEDGDDVVCDICGKEIKWKDGKYICPNCEQEFSRKEFFNYIGAEPPGKKCITCKELYPGCVSCPNGYLKEE